MSRLAMPLLALSGLLFVLGVAASSNPFMLASVAAAVAMLVSLMLGDRAEHATSTPTPKAVTPDTASVATSPVADAPATAGLEDLTVQELLARVEGLGPRRVEVLAEAFASSAALRAASMDELTTIPGVGPATAGRIMAGLTA
ncbi:MAG: putative flap endonuclease-1-like 5' DNA nuclease [Glaciecola sp.]|jgi:predicted flap endonuclease-1-like 5' DNA nuclease